MTASFPTSHEHRTRIGLRCVRDSQTCSKSGKEFGVTSGLTLSLTRQLPTKKQNPEPERPAMMSAGGGKESQTDSPAIRKTLAAVSQAYRKRVALHLHLHLQK